MSLGGGGGGQLEQLSQQIQAIEQEKETLQEDIEELQEEQSQIDEAIEGLRTLESGSIVQVPLGGDAYVRAEVQDIDEVIVSLGGGYAAEQGREAAIESLEGKKELLDDRIEDVEDTIDELDQESEQLEQQAQQAQQQMLQQMQQQQQQPDE